MGCRVWGDECRVQGAESKGFYHQPTEEEQIVCVNCFDSPSSCELQYKSRRKAT